MYFYRARYYDTTIGRFISRDPIGQVDNVNLYTYVGNNSIMFRDPSGKIKKFIEENKGKTFYIREHAEGLFTSPHAVVYLINNDGTDNIIDFAYGGFNFSRKAFFRDKIKSSLEGNNSNSYSIMNVKGIDVDKLNSWINNNKKGILNNTYFIGNVCTNNARQGLIAGGFMSEDGLGDTLDRAGWFLPGGLYDQIISNNKRVDNDLKGGREYEDVIDSGGTVKF